MTYQTCPAHRTPLVTHGEACPACDGDGTVPGAGLWADYCDECRGGGLRYECPACAREGADDDGAGWSERHGG